MIVAISGSVALLGDTIHNFADALTALPLGLAFWVGRRPATNRYTYGFGRAEDLAGVFIVITIAASSAFTAFVAGNRLAHPRHLHEVGWVIGAGLVGFAGNEFVAIYRTAGGTPHRIGRPCRRWAACPHRRVHVSFGRHRRRHRRRWLAASRPRRRPADHGRDRPRPQERSRDIYRRLMDAVDPALVDEITGVLASSPGIEAVQSVRVRWVGHELHAETEVTSDADLTLAQAHDIAEEAQHRLLHRVPRLARAAVHSSPCGHDGTDPHALTAHHFQ